MIELTAREAAEKIKDNATIAIVGMGLSGFPDEIARAIADRYNETGHPKDLTIKQGSAIGDFKERGTTRFGIEGLVQEYTGARIGAARGLIKLANEGKIQCHCLPQGMIVNQWREIASGKPGYLSKVGLHTFVDTCSIRALSWTLHFSAGPLQTRTETSPTTTNLWSTKDWRPQKPQKRAAE